MNKKLIYIPLLFAFIMLAGSCSEDFLEVEPRGKAVEEDYYQTKDQAYAALVAVYDVVGFTTSGYIAKLPAINSASDDFYAGGGSSSDITNFQVWNNYTLDPSKGPQEGLWSKGYQGAYRANILLDKLPNIDMDAETKARFTAEARCLRAFFYFDLIRFFKNIPLMDKPIPFDQVYDVKQVDRKTIFDFIEADLLAAEADLPDMVTADDELGRVSKAVVYTLLGKLYLEQGQFDDAAKQFAKVNGTPGAPSPLGYSLLPNFRDLFLVGNEFNSESILEVSHTNSSNGVWDCVACSEGNLMNILVGPRGYSKTDPEVDAPDLVAGWSFNPVTESLVNAFVKNGQYDPRYKYTIYNIDSLATAGAVTYNPGYDNTGYFLAKFSGKKENQSTGGGNYELNFPQNTYEIRLADVYLLEAEALVRGGGSTTGRALDLVNAVRNRVGADSVTVADIDVVLNERRLELAGEGMRWFDLVRNGRAATVLGDMGFTEGKHEFLPIPLLELNNTSLVQDPAY